MKLSEFLKIERKKRCLLQVEMAKKIGVTRATYVTYENGWVDSKGITRAPGIKIVKKIARLTGVSAENIQNMIEEERNQTNG